jgi:O-antigen ligase
VWDLVQEDRLWFSTEPAAPSPTASRATVTGVGTGGPLVAADPPRRAVRPGRVVLWRAAGRIFAAHPLLGVGPDNFRLIYGTYAGLKGADPRTHSNNMYLEVLVGGGLLGAAAFSWLLREAVSTFISICKGSDPGHVAVAMAGGAIALHATVDSFLSFAPTYVLFALTLGFAAAIARGMEHAADAHRV